VNQSLASKQPFSLSLTSKFLTDDSWLMSGGWRDSPVMSVGVDHTMTSTPSNSVFCRLLVLCTTVVAFSERFFFSLITLYCVIYTGISFIPSHIQICIKNLSLPEFVSEMTYTVWSGTLNLTQLNSVFWNILLVMCWLSDFHQHLIHSEQKLFHSHPLFQWSPQFSLNVVCHCLAVC